MDTQRLDSEATTFGGLRSGPPDEQRDEQLHVKTRSETSVLKEVSTWKPRHPEQPFFGSRCL